MLVAYDQNHQMIMAINANKQQQLFCSACHERVILRFGHLRVPHFAHQKGTDCNSFSEGETSEHLLGKQQLYEFFMDDSPTLEYYFKSIKQRPDLLLSHQRIIEFQCSPISDSRLSERLIGYESINHKSTWILGIPYLNRRFSYKKLKQFMMYDYQIGFYIMYWDVKNVQLLIHYRIRMEFDRLVYNIITISKLADLRHFFKNPPPLSPLNISGKKLADRLKKITIKLQVRINKKRISNQLLNLCYQNGFNLAGYPVEIDFPVIQIPVLGNKLTDYKLVMLLILKQHVKIDSHQLIKRTQQWLGIKGEFHMIDSIIILKAFQTVFNDWHRQGIIIKDNEQIKLVRFPKWYSSSDIRLQYINQIIKKH